MAKSLKVEWDKLNRKIEFPKSFEELVKISESWITVDKKFYELIFKDSKSEKMITNEESFNDYKSSVIGTGKVLAILRNKEKFSDDLLVSEIIENKDKSINNNSNENEELFESQLKTDIQKIVAEKTKIIKENLMKEIIKKINENSKIENSNNKLIIHEGISCSKCNICPIKGKRFKCMKCPNFNLCEECESKKEHDIYHIFLQIINPTNDELLQKIYNKNISYIIETLNYSLSPNSIFNQKKENEFTSKFELKNIGQENWFNGFSLVCSKNSEIIGSTYKIESKIKSNSLINIEVIFNIKDIPKGTYKVYYQMCNNQNVFFGPLTEISVTIW